MASSVRLVYQGPHDLVEVPGVDEPVRRGQSFTCLPELAGALGSWCPVPPEWGPGELAFHDKRLDDDGNVVGVYRLGHGLLAQTWTDPETGEVLSSFTFTPVDAVSSAVAPEVEG